MKTLQVSVPLLAHPAKARVRHGARLAGGDRPTRQHGLTLVEMLVAMVILGFMMALVSEVVFQVSQVARTADSVSRGALARFHTGWSAEGLLSNLLAPEEAGDNPSLTGTASRLSGFSALPLDGSEVGIQPFELELKPAATEAKATELWATSRPAGAARAEPVVIARFARRAEFAFADRQGALLSAWPPLADNANEAGALPRAVAVRDADSGALLMWYAFQGEVLKARPIINPFEPRTP